MSHSNSGILVRGELSAWHAVGIVVGVLAFVGGAILVVCQLPAGWFVAATGVVLGLSIGSVAILATVITLGIILIGAAAYQQHHVAQQNGRLHR